MLKKHFTTAHVLVFLDIDCKFCLESDASNFATGAVLSIEKDSIWHPVTFSSHLVMPQEQNYLVTDKEMLSVIQAVEQCHYDLEGARYQFEIWNDHANLQWFMMRQDLNCWQAQWAIYLSWFNMLWFYKPGHTMTKQDVLSRREDHTIGIEDDNKGIVVITLDKIRTTILMVDDGDILK